MFKNKIKLIAYGVIFITAIFAVNTFADTEEELGGFILSIIQGKNDTPSYVQLKNEKILISKYVKVYDPNNRPCSISDLKFPYSAYLTVKKLGDGQVYVIKIKYRGQ